MSLVFPLRITLGPCLRFMMELDMVEEGTFLLNLSIQGTIWLSTQATEQGTDNAFNSRNGTLSQGSQFTDESSHVTYLSNLAAEDTPSCQPSKEHRVGKLPPSNLVHCPQEQPKPNPTL